MSNEEIFATTALTSWNQWSTRADKFVDTLPEDKFHLELAPGRNRTLYVIGHLASVHDAMLPQLRLGEAKYPQLRDIFVTNPDKAATDYPSPNELKSTWKDISAHLAEAFLSLRAIDWLERHSSVSEEDFAKEPHRNRLAILLSRTGHLSYHTGQLLLLPR